MATKPICAVPNCGKPARGNGCLCNAHRIRLWRHGRAEAGTRKRQAGSVPERFWAFVDKSDGCWLWNGSLNNKGYGEIGAGPGNHNVLAHRASWAIHFGEIPKGLGVLHRCDTPSCVNPNHLFLGDQKMNMTDCKSKKRTTIGERNPGAKLTEDDVRQIRKMVRGGMTHTDASKLFSVNPATISMIVNKKLWPHIV